MNPRTRVLIMGAAGRDFHNFNVAFRDDSTSEVIAFTATQIPNISGRSYPAELAGELYPNGIPIHPEESLEQLIHEHQIDEVVFAYSDVSHLYVMHMAARANAAGADFRLMGNRSTCIESRLPVLSVCATRTGVGKSQTSRALTDLLNRMGLRAAAIRHPMPYGDLAAQRCQRYGSLEDMDRFECTIEEREEYEKHIQAGHILYAGVDYEEILRRAEAEADVILWDGGNNDTPFYRSDLHIVLVDPLRAGHELRYYPGETNVRMADIAIIAKSNSAEPDQIEEVTTNIRALNPKATIVKADSLVSIDDPAAIQGQRVLVVEDGPTVTHGGMGYGAGSVAAKQFGAAEIVDPRTHAVGSIRETFEKYPHLSTVLPAMGYGDTQIRELRETIDRTDCDSVLVGTPIDLGTLLECSRPTIRVSYELDPGTVQELESLVRGFLARHAENAKA